MNNVTQYKPYRIKNTVKLFYSNKCTFLFTRMYSIESFDERHRHKKNQIRKKYSI